MRWTKYSYGPNRLTGLEYCKEMLRLSKYTDEDLVIIAHTSLINDLPTILDGVEIRFSDDMPKRFIGLFEKSILQDLKLK